MNSFELEIYMKNDPWIQKYYGGVVPKELLPLQTTKPSFYEENQGTREQIGSHWVVVFNQYLIRTIKTLNILILYAMIQIYISNSICPYKVNSTCSIPNVVRITDQACVVSTVYFTVISESEVIICKIF